MLYLDFIPGRRDALHKYVEPIEAIVWHFTGGSKNPKMNLVEGGAALSGRRGVGWHFTIPRQAPSPGRLSVLQHYSWDERVGHAGGSILNGRGNVNGRTYGVELANLGPVVKYKGKWVSSLWLADGAVVPMRGSNIFTAPGGTTHEAFSDYQLEAAAQLKALFDRRFKGVAHVRHSEIKRGKPDPGPAFTLDL